MASSATRLSASAPLPASPFEPTPYTVLSRTPETPDTATIVLAPPRGRRIPAFTPGQFNMLYAFGLGEVAISISGNTTGTDKLVHTVRAVGKISTRISNMKPGETVGVRGPYGFGWPVEKAEKQDVIVVAGGLGLAPLRPALYQLFEHRDRFERVEVIYGARSPRELVYYDEIQSWRALKDVRFQVTVDAAGRDWYGDVGLVTARIPDSRFEAARTTAFVCGPEIMMRLTAKALAERGIPEDQIWVSMERNMKCAIGLCGHCQFGPSFICRDGPVFRYKDIKPYMTLREI
jgi:NAD(P)H-flavin reductase